MVKGMDALLNVVVTINNYLSNYVLIILLIGTGLFFSFRTGFVQVRLSEALCALVLFTPAAVPGLWIGCMIANLTTGVIWDVVFGSLATLLGAAGGRLLARLSERADRAGKGRRAALCRCLIPLPTVAANTLIVPFVLKYAYGYGDAVWLMMATVGLGEIISAYVCGLLLMWALRTRGARFLKP